MRRTIGKIPISIRRAIRRTTAVALLVVSAYSYWHVHQPRSWQYNMRDTLGRPVAYLVEDWGWTLAELTDSLNLTGEDTVAPLGKYRVPAYGVLFAGQPAAVHQYHTAITVLTNAGYVVGYSDTMKNPLWAAYRVFPVTDLASPPRPPRFEMDLRTQAKVKPQDYIDSGYDRGHMAPNYAIATRCGAAAQLETFLMSNIAPQKPILNRELWRRLEHRISEGYGQKGEVWVLCGPIFDKQPAKMRSGIPVPRAFYQIITDTRAGQMRVMAFIVPQKIFKRAHATPYLTSVEEVEKQTGLDFLSALPDDVKKSIKQKVPTRLWPGFFWRCVLGL